MVGEILLLFKAALITYSLDQDKLNLIFILTLNLLCMHITEMKSYGHQ